MEYSIENGRIKAVIDSVGAKIKSVRVDGVEKVGKKGSFPVLFPVCGRSAFVLNGENKGMPFHGFANKMDFSLTKQETSALTLSITDTEQTRAVFPYAFEFSVEYALAEDGLMIRYMIENRSETEMYFSCGGHEGYLLEGKISDYAVRFSEDEVFVNQLHDKRGCLNGKTKCLGEGKTFPLKKRYFFRCKTIILKNIHSRKVEIIDKNGRSVNEISFDGFQNLLFWMPPKTTVLCVEPWNALPDTVGEQGKEFSEKEGVQRLGSGEKMTLVRSIAYR